MGKIKRLSDGGSGGSPCNYLLLWIKLMSLTFVMTLPHNGHNNNISLLSFISTSLPLISGRQQNKANDQEGQGKIITPNSFVQGKQEESIKQLSFQEEECHLLYYFVEAKNATRVTATKDEEEKLEKGFHTQDKAHFYFQFDEFIQNGSRRKKESFCFRNKLICTLNLSSGNVLLNNCIYFAKSVCTNNSDLKNVKIKTGFHICNQSSYQSNKCDNVKSFLLIKSSGQKERDCVCPFGYKGIKCNIIDFEKFNMESTQKLQSQNEIKEILLKYQKTDRYFIGVTLITLLLLAFFGVLVVVICCTYLFVCLSFNFMHVMVLGENQDQWQRRDHICIDINDQPISGIDRLKMFCCKWT